VLSFVLGALLAVSVGATVLVLVAFGVGSVLAKVLPFSTFEATLLVLLAIIAVASAVWRGIENLEDREMEEAWDDWAEDGMAMPEGGVGLADGPPHGPPSPSLNTPCPCGSGKRYRKCCGSKKPEVS
jgi:hypothetical protein